MRSLIPLAVIIACSVTYVILIDGYWMFLLDNETRNNALDTKHWARMNSKISTYSHNVTTISDIANWQSSITQTSDKLSQGFESSITCSKMKFAPLNHKVCKCSNCCVYNNEIFVFDDVNPNIRVKKESGTVIKKVSMQLFEKVRSITVNHHSPRYASLNFYQSVWVDTPTYYTSNFYKHILAQWFWASDIYATWKYEGWLKKDFNWMLEFNLGQREHLVDTWYTPSHPMKKPPVKLYRGAGKENRETKVCFTELMIGQHHLAQGLWENIHEGAQHLGENTTPNFKINPLTKGSFLEYKYYIVQRKKLLASVEVIPRKAIFISREAADKRRILNREELCHILALNGFDVEVVEYEKLSFDEANKITRSASLIVGAHGAGFANIAVAHDNIAVIELHPWGFQKWIYAHFAHLLNTKYFYWVAPSEEYVMHNKISKYQTAKVGDINRYRHRDILVDVNDFRKLVMESKRHLMEYDFW